jgi:hypothetical protein
MPLIDRIDPEAVRRALDPAADFLDASSLPEGAIRGALFGGAAVTEVLALDPEAEAREGADAQRVTNALNLLTAAHVAPSLAQVLEERLGGLSVKREQVDYQRLARQLRRRAVAEMVIVTGAAGVAAGVPPMFRTAGPRC